MVSRWPKMGEFIKTLNITVGVLPGLLVLGVIVAAREVGLLQLMEWQALDFFMLNGAIESPDERITIIGIDETSVQAIGQYPIPDQQLADVLQRLNQYHPRVIGLDLFRDLPVAPGSDALTDVLQTTESLIGIDKVLPPVVAPPPALPPQQVGFADTFLDRDGRWRRMLLGVPILDEFRFSFSLLLAQAHIRQLVQSNCSRLHHPSLPSMLSKVDPVHFLHVNWTIEVSSNLGHIAANAVANEQNVLLQE